MCEVNEYITIRENDFGFLASFAAHTQDDYRYVTGSCIYKCCRKMLDVGNFSDEMRRYLEIGENGRCVAQDYLETICERKGLMDWLIIFLQDGFPGSFLTFKYCDDVVCTVNIWGTINIEFMTPYIPGDELVGQANIMLYTQEIDGSSTLVLKKEGHLLYVFQNMNLKDIFIALSSTIGYNYARHKMYNHYKHKSPETTVATLLIYLRGCGFRGKLICIFNNVIPNIMRYRRLAG